MSAHISASVFNDGMKNILLMLKCMNVRVGNIAVEHCRKADKLREKQCTRRSDEATKQGRIDKKKEEPGGSGSFSGTGRVIVWPRH